MIRLVLALILIVSLGISAARADLYRLDEAVAGQAGTTWFDVASSIVTDLRMIDGEWAEGAVVIPVRHLVEGFGGRPPALVRFRQLYAYPFNADGREQTLVFLDLGWTDDRTEPTAIVALFDEDLRLVDAADIGTDRVVQVDRLPFPVSRSSDAMVFRSQGGNSAMNSSEYALILFRDGRLRLIDTFRTTDASDCGWYAFQSVSFDSSEAPDPFWPITVTMNDKLEVDLTVSCPDPISEDPYDRTASTTYRWDTFQERYLPDNAALDDLRASSSDRY